MKRSQYAQIAMLFFLLDGYHEGFSQNKATVLQNIGVNLPDNSVQQITAAKVRETLNGIVNYASTMTPSMSIAQLRAGNAGDANAVIIDDLGKRGLFVYNPNSQAADDGVAVVVANGKRFERQEGHVTPEMFGAKGDMATDDTQSVVDALAVKKELFLSKDYKVTSFFNKYGVPITGPGRILKNVTQGTTTRQQLLTSYADVNQRVFGQEYLYHLYNKLLTRSSSTVILGDLIGDSTTEGGASIGTSEQYRLHNLLGTLLVTDGIGNVNVRNRGISSETLTHWRASVLNGQLSSYGDFLVIRWGINDPAFAPGPQRTADQYLADLDAALTTIRASKPVTSCSILLMAPNSVSDTFHNRDEKWFEAIAGGTRSLARKHYCAYMDTYGMFQDSRHPAAAGGMMDNPFGDGSGIHPTNTFNTLIAGEMYNILFPEAFRKIVGTPSNVGGTGDIVNQSSTVRIVASGDLPQSFSAPVSLNRATTGMPFDGMSTTVKQADNVWFQISTPYLATDSWKIPKIRYGAGFNGPAWGPWIRMGVATPTRSQKTVSASTTLDEFEIGESIFDVTTFEGWPANGVLKVERTGGGLAVQRLVKITDPNYVEWSRVSYYNGSVAVWTPWSITGTLKGAKTYNPPLIPANSYVTTTVLVPGSIMGKTVRVSFSLDSGDDVEISARVSAEGVVKAKFRNLSAAPIELNEGILYVTCDM